MRIKTSWIALSVAVLSVGLLLVVGLEGPLFSGGQQSAVPERSGQLGSVSVKPTAPSSTTATPSSAPPAPAAAAPSPKPAPMLSEQPAPSPAPDAAVPSALSGAVLPTTPPARPAPTAAMPSALLPAAPPAPAAAAPAAKPPPSALPAEAEMGAADRRQVQEALGRLDYYKGPVDGIFGPLTRAAIRRFQQNIGSAATGYLTADQANRLVTPR